MMRRGLRWILSLLFILQMYLAMALLGIAFAPWALVSSAGALRAAKLYSGWVLFSARVMLGLRCEVRGKVPEGEVMVAAKHQSFLDILIIFDALPRPKFIMKKELLWTPFLGLYARRVGCVPVDRSKRGAALARMVDEVLRGGADPAQLVIYPQGTRVPPGERRPYKGGSAVLYGELGQPCVPAATNVGLFWPRRGITRHAGTAVVEFLEPIPPGMERAAFMAALEQRIEAQSDALLEEARRCRAPEG